jgi:hypothetical protein
MPDQEAIPDLSSTESGFVFWTITQYWPRIAAGLVIGLGVLDLVLGGLTSDSSLEFYLMAWGATTGGLWFLAEKAENALSENARQRVVRWLQEADYTAALKSMPAQFVTMFDRVFGERHWSMKCFLRSCVASVCSVTLAYALCRSLGFTLAGEVAANLTPATAAALLFAALTFNAIPDYLSLLETRWLLGVAQRRLRTSWILGADILMTSVIFAVFTLAVLLVLTFTVFKGAGVGDQSDAYFAGMFLGLVISDPVVPIAVLASTFFTSVWLWLYALSVPFSRLLLRMNSGLGFLLKVTDVEEQPFRSMGFTSVVLVSLLFLFGLPLVLLS